MFTAPIAVGLELNLTGSYHRTVFVIAAVVCCGALTPLCLPTPGQLEEEASAGQGEDTGGESEKETHSLLGEGSDSSGSVFDPDDEKKASRSSPPAGKAASTRAKRAAAAAERLRTERVLLGSVYAFVFLYCIAELSVGTCKYTSNPPFACDGWILSERLRLQGCLPTPRSVA